MAITVVVTQVGVEHTEAREKACKEALGNYECAICHRYIWWDEPHSHKFGQTVRYSYG